MSTYLTRNARFLPTAESGGNELPSLSVLITTTGKPRETLCGPQGGILSAANRQEVLIKQALNTRYLKMHLSAPKHISAIRLWQLACVYEVCPSVTVGVTNATIRLK